MSEEVIIFEDSADAAQIKTVTGWVSRIGRFWGDDERMARYDGCTHRRCDCGEVFEIRSYCRKCSSKRDREKYLSMPRKVWSGEPICLYDGDKYFFEEDELLYYCEENECQPKDLDLVFCTPEFAKEIDPNDYYSDELPEDGEVPPAIAEAFQKLNAAIMECKDPLCWYPGKVAVDPMSLPNLSA